MELLSVLFIAVCILVYTTGTNNAASTIATLVATRHMLPHYAILMATIVNFLGSFFGIAVAVTISTQILNSDFISTLPPANALGHIVLNGVFAAILWNIGAFLLGLPSSATHALIGGICGAAIAFSGSMDSLLWSWTPVDMNITHWNGLLWKVLIPMFLTPALAYVSAWFMMKILNVILFHKKPHKISAFFAPLQIFSSACVGFAHGMNNTPKMMGVFLVALISASNQGILDNLPECLSFIKVTSTEKFPFWLLGAGATVLAVGTAMGGWKITKNMSRRVVHLRSVSAFAAQTTSAGIIVASSLLGFTIANNYITTSAIVGSGTASRYRSLGKRMLLSILFSWALNIPISFLIGYLLLCFSRTGGWLY